MKKLLLRKLIVISQIEQASKEIEFVDGLNIIIGQNKTGKSSLIKSIFYALGSELKLETEWKKIINYYILFFNYGDEYCVIRQGKSFRLLKFIDNDYEVIVDTDKFGVYSTELMKVLEVSMICTNKSTGDEISATAPLIFRFQYIDQDKGWNDIANSFQKLGYIKDWKPNSNKYISGYMGDEYYFNRRKIDLLKSELEALKAKKNSYNELISSLENNIEVKGSNDKLTNNAYDIANYTNIQVKELLDSLSRIRKENIQLDKNLERLKNNRYSLNLNISFIKNMIEEMNSDYDFAVNADEEIICPFCGMQAENDLIHRVEIIKDIQQGSELLGVYRQDLKIIEDEIQQITSQIKQNNRASKIISLNISHIEESSTIIDNFKNEGKREVINEAYNQRKLVDEEIASKVVSIDKKKDKIKSLQSRKRHKEISDSIRGYLRSTFDTLDIPQQYIKLRDFVQQLGNTGSELPRVVYAYHTALFLHNLSQERGLFNFLVIDTPNQQGQDEKNLNNIHDLTETLLNSTGQIVLGTERETGYEQTDNTKVYKLKEKRKCLTKDKYNEHFELLKSYCLK